MAQAKFRVFDHAAIAKPAEATARTLKYKPEQEHMLRRLGQAIVLHWQEVPKGLQEVLVAQAAMVDDRDDTKPSVHALGAFVEDTGRCQE